MFHLQIEGPRIAQVEKMMMFSSTLTREAVMSSSFYLEPHQRSPGIRCNDENFLGFLSAREEHNASF